MSVPRGHTEVLRFVATMRDEIDTIRHNLADPPTDRFDLLEDELDRFEEWVIEGQRIMVARIEKIVAEIEALAALPASRPHR
jgi:hypothetical protein